MQENELLRYLAPEVYVSEVIVERGFAGSIEDPTENPEMDW